MNSWLLTNSVLVVDNATIHKVASIHEMVEEHGVHLLYLPPYSPDYNPIELAFSKIKTWLRVNRDHMNRELESGQDQGTVYDVLWEAVHVVTQTMQRGGTNTAGTQYPTSFFVSI